MHTVLLVLTMILPYLVIFILHRRSVLVFWVYFFAVMGKSQILVIVPVILAEHELPQSIQYYFYLLSSYYLIIAMILLILFYLVKDENRAWSGSRALKSYGSTLIVGLMATLCFSVLIINSNFVFLFDPRRGYQYFRDGVGIFWAFYITFISALFYFSCIRRKISLLKIFIFAYLFYLTGSKQLVVVVLMFSYVAHYVHFGYVDRRVTALLGVAAITLFLMLFGQFGAEENLIVRLTRYFDFVRNASRVFEDYDNGALDFQLGQIWLSSFWSYVPRGLFPDKPYAYGANYVLEMYYPGLAATGHTPSFGPLTTEFVDFGWLGGAVYALTDVNTLLKLTGLIFLMKNRVHERSMLTQTLVLFSLTPAFGFHIPTPIALTGAFLTIAILIRSRGIEYK